METFGALTNSEVRALIDERIRGLHGERNRAVMKRRLIDGVTHERLAEEFQLSPAQIKRIVYDCTARLAQK